MRVLKRFVLEGFNVGLMVAVLAVIAVVAIARPVSAQTVSIEARVVLTDHSDSSVDRALRRALDTCVRGAIAMGLSTMWVDGASILSDAVSLRIVATDEESASEESTPGGGDEQRQDDVL